MTQQETLFDRVISRIKNNPVIASLHVVAVIVISLATFMGAVKTLFDLSPENSTETARIKLVQLGLDFNAEGFLTRMKAGMTI